ncbi:MAG: hypothetical protein HY010_19830 [Acidobacteria bacterium]|nr:hypothetical protein [Acidobacteriota bacterium]
MTSKNQPNRWESTLLAGIMVVAGAPFLFDKLTVLVRTSSLYPAAAHSLSSMLLVAVGAILVMADQIAMPAEPYQPAANEGDRHEL